jgi:replication factor C subunit 2/4
MISLNQLFEIDDIDSKKAQTTVFKDNIINKIPWVDKYRPSKLNDIVYQEEVILMLKKTLKSGVLPHILFYGPPGTGKTSTILAVAMEIFGPKKFKDRVIELNASDERGINVVRNKIVTFAKTSIGDPDPNYICPPYKIIILDEADAMTTEAQSALRKTMEDNYKIVRFCFICNYINQIIKPIISRCATFRFKPLNNKCLISKLKFISNRESLKLNNTCLKEVATISNGDMRKGIMLLQNLKYISNYKNITVDDVLEMDGFIPHNIKSNIENICLNDKNISCQQLIQLTKNIQTKGYPIDNIMMTINKIIINSDELTDIMKSTICLQLAKIEKRLIDGADEYL